MIKSVVSFKANEAVAGDQATEKKPSKPEIKRWKDVYPEGYRQEKKELRKKSTIIGLALGAGVVLGTIAHKAGEVIIGKKPAKEVLEKFVEPVKKFLKTGHQPLMEAFKNKKYFKGSWESIKYPVKGLFSALNCYPTWAKVALGLGAALLTLNSEFESGRIYEKYDIDKRAKEFGRNLEKKLRESFAKK